MSEVMLCETTGKCTCGAPATTPRGMHHGYCGVRTAAERPIVLGDAAEVASEGERNE